MIKSYFPKPILTFLLCIGLIFVQQLKAKEEALELFDKTRQRLVPVLIYSPSEPSDTPLPVIVISHGYGAKNSEYSHLSKGLADSGYFIVCPQHDLDGDPELPRTGNLFEGRMSFWQRGKDNILFALNEIKKRYPYLDTNKVILIGHSNGGDMSMLMATELPERVKVVVSLDSLRHPFPIKDRIPLLSFRATDTKADPGVLPETGATFIELEAKHIELCDRGAEKTKEEVLNEVLNFLSNILEMER